MKKTWPLFICMLPCLVSAQSLTTRGQLWIGGLNGNDEPENQSSFETSIGYIPTLSLFKDIPRDRLLDIELAYRFEQYYSGDSLILDGFDPHRAWVRFSSQTIEARLGLQKITFGPAQILRSLSWFDTIDLKDPTGQTDGVDAFRLRWYPSNSLALWIWAVQNEHGDVSYGGRGELSTHLGEWGITVHHDTADSSQSIGQTGSWIDQVHTRTALDFRYDGFLGLWNESVLIFSEDYNITLVTVGADYTVPISTGILLTSESMLISESQNNVDHIYTAFMASMPLGIVHQLMFITQRDWEEEKNYNYLRWSATYDQYSLNFIASISPKRSAYNAQDFLLPNTAAGFGTNFQFMFIYNH